MAKNQGPLYILIFASNFFLQISTLGIAILPLLSACIYRALTSSPMNEKKKQKKQK